MTHERFDASRSSLPFVALAGFALVLFVAPQSIWPALAPLRLAMAMVAIAITSHLGMRVANGHPLFILGPELRLALGLLGWAVLTVPFSVWPGGSVDTLTSLYAKSITLFWLVGAVLDRVDRVRRMGWLLSFISLYLSTVSIRQYLGAEFLSGGMGNRIVGYEASLTGNPNDMAFTLGLLLPIGLALRSVEKTDARRLFLLAVAGLTTIGIIVTLSRGGFLMLATTFFAYIYRLPGRRRLRAAIGLLILAIVVTPYLPSEYFNRVGSIVDIDADETGSAQARWDGMMASVALIMRHPIIGVGIGQNVLALNEIQGRASWKVVHNAYLQYGVDLGLPGLLLFLFLVRSTLVGLAGAVRSPSPQLSGLAVGVETSLIAFLVGALTAPFGYHFYFYFVAGLAVALRQIHDAPRLPQPSRSP